MAALGLAVTSTDTFKICRSQIVQIDCLVEIEQCALTRHQPCFDRRAMRMELVDHTVERIFVAEG